MRRGEPRELDLAWPSRSPTPTPLPPALPRFSLPTRPRLAAVASAVRSDAWDVLLLLAAPALGSPRNGGAVVSVRWPDMQSRQAGKQAGRHVPVARDAVGM